jgi:protoporphyrinogen oxidase
MIILGGGVAGLAASLESGADVYESGDSLGGVAASRVVDGFTFDYGIHVLQTRSARVLDMLRSLGVDLRSRHRNAMIYSHRTYTPYPFQVNTAGLPVGLRVRCLWEFFRRDSRGKPANYQEWIYRTMGRGYGDTFLVPYSEKFWTVHPREMTYDWTNRRIPSASPWQMILGAVVSRQTKIGSNAVFQYPGHGSGFGAIPERMGRALPNVHLNHRATRIDVGRRRVEFNDGRAVVGYDTIVSTIPLPELIRLIPDAPADVREAAGRLRHNSILVVNLGVARAGLSDLHWVHFPEKDVCFFRISFPHNLGPGMVPEGMSSVAAEVSYSDWEPVDKGAVADRVVADLVRVGILRADDRISVKDVMDVKYGYVIYDQYRRRSVATVRRWLESAGIHTTGRYGLWAYLWSHESIQAGANTGRRLGRCRGG